MDEESNFVKKKKNFQTIFLCILIEPKLRFSFKLYLTKDKNKIFDPKFGFLDKF